MLQLNANFVELRTALISAVRNFLVIQSAHFLLGRQDTTPTPNLNISNLNLDRQRQYFLISTNQKNFSEISVKFTLLDVFKSYNKPPEF